MAKTSRAVVIGSGFGGLAAAVRLGARGYDVTVCEKLDKPGGRAYVYEDSGYTFDAGPTVITAPESLEELFEVALAGLKRRPPRSVFKADSAQCGDPTRKVHQLALCGALDHPDRLQDRFAQALRA